MEMNVNIRNHFHQQELELHSYTDKDINHDTNTLKQLSSRIY